MGVPLHMKQEKGKNTIFAVVCFGSALTVNLGLVGMKYIFPDSILIYLHRENKIRS